MPWRRYDARNPMRSPSTLNRLRVCCARKSRHGTKLQSDSRRVSEAARRRRGRMAQVLAIWELASVLLGASSACPDEAQTSVIRAPASRIRHTHSFSTYLAGAVNEHRPEEPQRQTSRAQHSVQQCSNLTRRRTSNATDAKTDTTVQCSAAAT